MLLDQKTLPMYAVSDELAPRIEKYGLGQNLVDMEQNGFTVITDVDLSLADRIRKTILGIFQEKSQFTPGFGHVEGLLLGVDPVFSEAVLYPPLLALAEYMCGRSCRLNTVEATVKRQGDNPLFLHVDQAWLPAPFPEHNAFFTACFVTEDLSPESGPTMVIPGTHRHRRDPSFEEVQECKGAVPILAKKGSIVCWDGSVWHGNYERALPGERVFLHVSYCRLAYSPVDNYDHLGQDFLDQHPPEMTTLLGRNLAFGTPSREHWVDWEKLYQMTLDAKR